jgi:hypothetical protein
MAEVQPEFGRHLYERVSTSAVCRYEPDPTAPVGWLLAAGRPLIGVARAGSPFGWACFQGLR